MYWTPLIWRVHYLVDMGADEYAYIGDCDLDGYVNLVDFSILASQWLNNCGSPDWCQVSDFDQSGSVNVSDLTELLQHWLERY
jgi:hypothetical protein